MNLWLTERLDDFGSRDRTRAPAKAAALPEASELEGTMPLDDYARGESAGREAALAECEARIEALKAEQEEQLAEARSRWVKEQAEKLSEAWRHAVSDFEARIGDQLAAALMPFLDEEQRERALESLSEALAQLTGPEAPSAFRIKGPPDLLEALKPKLSEAGPSIDFAPDEDAVEVVAVVEDTRIETTLGAWRDRLRESP